MSAALWALAAFPLPLARRRVAGLPRLRCWVLALRSVLALLPVLPSLLSWGFHGRCGALPWSVASVPGALKRIDPKLVAWLQLGFTVAGEQRDYLRDLTILPYALGR